MSQICHPTLISFSNKDGMNSTSAPRETNRIDLEKVVDQTRQELLDLKKSIREYEEKEQAVASTQVAASPVATGLVIDAEIVEEKEVSNNLVPVFSSEA